MFLLSVAHVLALVMTEFVTEDVALTYLA